MTQVLSRNILLLLPPPRAPCCPSTHYTALQSYICGRYSAPNSAAVRACLRACLRACAPSTHAAAMCGARARALVRARDGTGRAHRGRSGAPRWSSAWMCRRACIHALPAFREASCLQCCSARHSPSCVLSERRTAAVQVRRHAANSNNSLYCTVHAIPLSYSRNCFA